MASITELLALMERLRDPENGCPWDIAQRFETIAPFTIEEAYEVADAITRGNRDELKDELGDLLFQVVFHAQMAKEEGAFSFDEVVTSIYDKLVRRHPHVFSDGQAKDAADVLNNWEAIKQQERAAKGQDDSALAGVAGGLPEWMRAIKLQKRAARTGFEWPNISLVIAKLREEIEEVEAELSAGSDTDRLEDEIGDLLFVSMNLARHAKVDPGVALRRANAKFEMRFRQMEQLASQAGQDFSSLSLDQQEALWAAVKTHP